MPDLIITYDDRPPETVTLESVLGWKDWSPRSRDILSAVASGDARRFSTSRDGVFCDIELVAA